MKRKIRQQIVRSIGIFAIFWGTAGAAHAQYVVSAKAGIIQFMVGNVFLDDKPVRLTKGGYLQMKNGQRLRTERGFSELLLGTDVYLRLGMHGQLRMYQNQLNDTQLALEKGSAMIEVVEMAQGSQIRIVFASGLVEIRKKGLYRLDGDSRELRVYGGEAGVAKKDRKAKIKKGKMVRLNDDFESSKFDAEAPDMLHQWAALRSFTLFADNPATRKQEHWTYIELGWLKNYNYGMSFRSTKIYAERIGNRNAMLSAEATMAAAADRARREAEARARQQALEAMMKQAMRASQRSQVPQ
jgi:hypothetical protein